MLKIISSWTFLDFPKNLSYRLVIFRTAKQGKTYNKRENSLNLANSLKIREDLIQTFGLCQLSVAVTHFITSKKSLTLVRVRDRDLFWDSTSLTAS